MTTYLTVYAGIGISIRDIDAPSPEQAAQLAMDTFEMNTRGGDTVYVVERSAVQSFFVQQDSPTLTTEKP